MLKIICLFIIVFTHLTIASEDITIAAEDSAGPWGDKNGNGAGNEIVIEAFKAVNINAKLQIVPYGRAKHLVLAGKAVACFSMSWEPALKDKIIFSSEPLYTVFATLFKNSQNKTLIDSINQIPSKSTIGTVLGYEYPENFNALKNRNVSFDEARDELTNIKKLARNRVDYIILMLDELKTLEYLISDNVIEKEIAKALVISKQGSYVGFSMLHPAGQKTKEKFDKGLSIIKKNGVYKSIIDKWKNKLIHK